MHYTFVWQKEGVAAVDGIEFEVNLSGLEMEGRNLEKYMVYMVVDFVRL